VVHGPSAAQVPKFEPFQQEGYRAPVHRDQQPYQPAGDGKEIHVALQSLRMLTSRNLLDESW
jgi:hypothetical protein